jgi:ATP-dependent 26S proteasome regulatory subunit
MGRAFVRIFSVILIAYTQAFLAFFMRKGADCLSKWVGEAERQLRLLFEEAKNSQPSIIFFDEIDGLAPVRSSKQDQIHASIVSTLLALMDGMDGRGQVVVIGATNRPDAIDPALRRPGRFDREFYFPLPNQDARERIIRIMTKKWAGWEDGKGEQNAKGLAKLTKGYGGADLRVSSSCLPYSACDADHERSGAMYGGCLECCATTISPDLQVERSSTTAAGVYRCRASRLYDLG